MSLTGPLEQFNLRVKANPDASYLNQPRDGAWTSYTWREVDQYGAKNSYWLALTRAKQR